MKWLAFSYSLPVRSGSSPRVALWRRLRRLGAVSPTGGIQVLPDRPECVEAFQWLAQEMRQAGGDAVVMHVESFAGLTDQQLVELFHAACAEEYAELDLQTAELERHILTAVAPADLSEIQDALVKLRRRHADIARVDYFTSPAGYNVTASLARVARALTELAAPDVQISPVDVASYRNRRWVTRARPHVDRLACIWLLRRFVDPAAVIAYSASPEPDDVPFDIEEAKFGHQGNLCTFETMLQAFCLTEPALTPLAQIVHEIDLRDGLYARPEAPGVDAILAGWLAADFPDSVLEAHGVALFDGLYAALSSSPAG